MDDVHHVEKWKHYSHNDHSDNSANSDDNDWLYHTRNPFNSSIYIFIIPSCHFFEHTSKGACLLSNLYRHREFDWKTIDPSLKNRFILPNCFSSDFSFNIFTTQRRGKRFSGLDIGNNGIDFGFVVSIIHTGPDDGERPIYEDSRIE